MKPKSIGIVGGAGPLAGARLLERIISLSGSLYDCHKDADFPNVILLSFPFSEMLTPEMNVAALRQELNQCLHQLRSNGAAVLAIACNTLHAFLDDNTATDLVHLPRVAAEAIPPTETPLVLCTTTSMRFGVHKHFFPCAYPDAATQARVDLIIEQILKGVDRAVIVNNLLPILRAQQASTIILGCTELSLFSAELSSSGKHIIDPLEEASIQILERSFFIT